MNSLGFGLSQGSTNIVPTNMIVNNKINNGKFEKINTEFINSINELKKKNKEQSNLKRPTNITYNNLNRERNVPINNNNSNNSNSNYNNNISNQQQVNQNRNNNSDTLNHANVNWNNIFLSICKKRLFGYFKELKSTLNFDNYFNNKFICYIDETNTKFLIQTQQNNEIVTLRLLLNKMLENKDKGYISNIYKAIELVKKLELMGPSNNLLICLDKIQIKQLRNRFQNGKQLLWPSGTDGITWLVHFRT
jgi:hypothetical protein